MTIKTILAAASGGTASDGTLELACRFAQRFGAHLEALHVRPDPRDLVLASSDGMGLPLSQEFIDLFIRDTEVTAKKIKASFEAITVRHQLSQIDTPSKHMPTSVEASASWRDETGHAGTLVSRRGRFFDLVVLGRSGRVIDEPHTDVVEQTLIGSGRPVLLAPAKPPASVGDFIAVGWNGSAEAIRAVVGALPLIEKSRTVSIITIGEKHRESGTALAEYLAWRGVKAQTRLAPAVTGTGAGQQLLSAARDEDADLLVMGGYGHMPWREFFFGGATREVIGVSLLPLLLTH